MVLSSLIFGKPLIPDKGTFLATRCLKGKIQVNFKCVCPIVQLRQGSIPLRIKFIFLTEMVMEEIRMCFLSVSDQL